jgi:hypothetical protein
MIVARRIGFVPLGLFMALGVSGCGGGLGALGGVLGDILTGAGGTPQGGVVTVEIQQVRERQQQIIVRTQEGQEGPVLFDQNTQVVYQNRQHSVRDLERGDIVDMRVHQVQQGYYTDLIQVRTPVQERTAGTGTTPAGVHQVEGTIGTIDTSRSEFRLDMTHGPSVLVVIPSNAPAADHERLRQHRVGDYVRVELRPLDQARAELVRFGWS